MKISDNNLSGRGEIDVAYEVLEKEVKENNQLYLDKKGNWKHRKISLVENTTQKSKLTAKSNSQNEVTQTLSDTIISSLGKRQIAIRQQLQFSGSEKFDANSTAIKSKIMETVDIVKSFAHELAELPARISKEFPDVPIDTIAPEKSYKKATSSVVYKMLTNSVNNCNDLSQLYIVLKTLNSDILRGAKKGLLTVDNVFSLEQKAKSKTAQLAACRMKEITNQLEDKEKKPAPVHVKFVEDKLSAMKHLKDQLDGIDTELKKKLTGNKSDFYKWCGEANIKLINQLLQKTDPGSDQSSTKLYPLKVHEAADLQRSIMQLVSKMDKLHGGTQNSPDDISQSLFSPCWKRIEKVTQAPLSAQVIISLLDRVKSQCEEVISIHRQPNAQSKSNLQKQEKILTESANLLLKQQKIHCKDYPFDILDEDMSKLKNLNKAVKSEQHAEQLLSQVTELITSTEAIVAKANTQRDMKHFLPSPAAKYTAEHPGISEVIPTSELDNPGDESTN